MYSLNALLEIEKILKLSNNIMELSRDLSQKSNFSPFINITKVYVNRITS